MYAEVSFGKLQQQQDDIELPAAVSGGGEKDKLFLHELLAYLPSLDSRDWFCVVQ